MATMSLQNVTKKYTNEFTAVQDFNLTIAHGEFIVFVGPSGCGKSTTLRMIAGLEDISSGEFQINEKLMNHVEAKDRDIAMVFQSYALYPHMTVYDNMAFALKLKKTPKNIIDQKIKEASKILGLDTLLDRKPKALSGGQRQRVALGRAVVREPQVFLMDEPLSNLDAKLRTHMRSEIIKLHKRVNATTIYVTHDQVEAMTMADRIVVMDQGVIQQVDTPKNLYDYPKNIFVAGFIGSPAMNFIEVDYRDNAITFDQYTFQVPEGKLTNLGSEPKKLIIGIRPESISLSPLIKQTYPSTIVNATIDFAELLGYEYNLHFQIGESKIIATTEARTVIRDGEQLSLAFDMNKIHFFDPHTKEAIL